MQFFLLLTSLQPEQPPIPCALLVKASVIVCPLNRVPFTIIKPIAAVVSETGSTGLELGTLEAPIQLSSGSITRQCVFRPQACTQCD